jgi:hypothetical protein
MSNTSTAIQHSELLYCLLLSIAVTRMHHWRFRTLFAPKLAEALTVVAKHSQDAISQIRSAIGDLNVVATTPSEHTAMQPLNKIQV